MGPASVQAELRGARLHTTPRLSPLLGLGWGLGAAYGLLDGVICTLDARWFNKRELDFLDVATVCNRCGGPAGMRRIPAEPPGRSLADLPGLSGA